MTNSYPSRDIIIEDCNVCKTRQRFLYYGTQRSVVGDLYLYACEVCENTIGKPVRKEVRQSKFEACLG
jgi:hypothetical protein